jgi:hypothetical protein
MVLKFYCVVFLSLSQGAGPVSRDFLHKAATIMAFLARYSSSSRVPYSSAEFVSPFWFQPVGKLVAFFCKLQSEMVGQFTFLDFDDS